MNNQYYCISYIIILLLTTMARGVTDVPSPDKEYILQKAEETFTKRPPITFNVQTVSSRVERGKPEIVPKRKKIGTYFQDWKRVDFKSTRFDIVDHEEKAVLESRGIWDGTLYLHRTKGLDITNSKDVAYFSKDKTLKNICMISDSDSSFLDGFLGDGLEHYSVIMRKAPTLILQDKLENIDGTLCYVLEANSRRGHYKIWVDPKCGYHLRRAIVQKKSDDLYDDKRTLAQKGYKSLEINVNVTKLQSLNGLWLPTEGIKKSKLVFVGDNKEETLSISTKTASRSHVKLNPSFDKLGAFQMDLPNGTIIIDDSSNTPYEWENGRIQERGLYVGKMNNKKAPPLIIEQWYNTDFWQLDLKEKVIVLDFWGTWCVPCRKQIPFLKSLSQKYFGRDFQIIGVHTEFNKEAISDFISKENISYLVGVDYQGRTAKLYKVLYYPTVFIIDREGMIRSVNPKKEELEGIVDVLLEE